MKYSFTAFMTILLFPGLLLAGDLSTTEIVQKLRKKYVPFYQRHSGYTIKRYSDVTIREDDTKKIYRTVKSTVDRTAYFYKKGVRRKVYRYIKNGKPQELSSFKGQKESEPPYPFFDREGSDNYRFNLEGQTLFHGKQCYRLAVNPKKKSARHLQGTLYIEKKTLSILFFTGTTAKLSFGLKRIRFAIYFKDINGFDLPVRSDVTFLLHIPLFFPHKEFIVSSRLTNHRLEPMGE
jgi:hypothetical protein